MIDNVQHIEHLLTEKVAGRRVLVIGDLMLDRYLWGDVERISPEAPVPVVRLTETTETPGGAANVALNLAGLGVKVTLAGFVGKDDAGERLTSLLAGRGVGTGAICRVASMPTVVKSRVIVKRNQMLRLDLEDASQPPEGAREELAAEIVKRINEGVEAVVVSDYAKGVITASLMAEVVRMCRRQAIPLIVDPKGMDFARYRGSTCITPNFKEFCEAAGAGAVDEETLLRLARAMRERIGVETVVITRGEKGITAVGEQSCTVPAISREVFDVSGAGDTVVAVLAVAYIAGLSMEESLKLANIAAGVVIGKVGTVAINVGDLVAAVYQSEAVLSGDKLCGFEELLEKAEIWHAGGLRIGVITGKPDVLRAGDVELLEDTGRQCGRLIVLLEETGDNALAIHDLARVIAALQCVDAVVVAGGEEIERAIGRIRPEVLVRGWLTGKS